MQISRRFLVACAAACATTLAVRGNDDTSAQIKAREAMRQKMQDTAPQPAAPAPVATPSRAPAAVPVQQADSDSIAKAREALHQKLLESTPPQAPPTSVPAPAAASAAPPPVVPAPPPAAAPAPVAPPAAAATAVATDVPVPPPAQVVQQADPEAIAKAREAERQRIADNPATPPPAAVPTPAAVAPAPPPVAPPPAPPPVVVVPPQPASPNAPLATSTAADSDSVAKAREAVRQQISAEAETGPTADPQAIAKAREALRQRTESYTYSESTSQGSSSASFNFPPLEGPALPISSEKQQRLAELLQRYKADQVTPDQYQTERAKILASP